MALQSRSRMLPQPPTPEIPRTVALTAEDERRRAARLERSIPIHYRLEDQPYQRSMALDLSRTGARLKLRQPLQERTNVYLLFDLEPELKLTVTARMVWQKDVKGTNYQAGIRFTLPRDVESRLEGWIDRQTMDP